MRHRERLLFLGMDCEPSHIEVGQVDARSLCAQPWLNRGLKVLSNKRFPIDEAEEGMPLQFLKFLSKTHRCIKGHQSPQCIPCGFGKVPRDLEPSLENALALCLLLRRGFVNPGAIAVVLRG